MKVADLKFYVSSSLEDVVLYFMSKNLCVVVDIIKVIIIINILFVSEIIVFGLFEVFILLGIVFEGIEQTTGYLKGGDEGIGVDANTVLHVHLEPVHHVHVPEWWSVLPHTCERSF